MGSGMSLRRKFLLASLAASVLPLAVMSMLLVRSAGRSGEALLRDQLQQAIDGIGTDVEERWAYRRADVLLLTDNQTVIDALESPGLDRAAMDAFLTRATRQRRWPGPWT